MALPQVPVRHQFATSTITIPSGTGDIGGQFPIIDYIIVDFTTDATTNRVPLVTVAGTSTIFTLRKTIATASTSDNIFLTFPSGLPLVGSDGNPMGGTLTVAVSGTGVTLNGLAVGYHYRRFNG